MSEKGAGEKKAMSKGELYRTFRLIHGWLSAVCFLALLFFAVTGILLNHPDWQMGQRPPVREAAFELTAGEIEALRDAEQPGHALAELAASRAETLGDYQSGEVVGDDIFVRLQGVRGASDLIGHLADGRVEVIVEPEAAVTVFNGLHRGERAGPAWRLFIDVVAVALIVMSLIGYAIFLSLRFRLKTALILTGASLAVMAGLFVFFTP